MTFITSFINRGIFLDNIKRFSWIGVLYTLALFFAVPLHILMIYGQEDADYMSMKDLFYLRNGDMQSIVVLVASILVGIVVFHYLQVKASSDMMHSLPIKRKVFYRTHILTSLLLLILPVLITVLISWILNGALDLGQYYGLQDIAKWAGFIIIMELIIFFVCVAVGMMVGMSVVQGVLTGIFLFLPLGLTVLLTEALGTLLYGFRYDLALEEAKLSPVARLIEGFRDIRMGTGEIAAYLIVCLGLYFLSQWLYQKRRLEAASQTIVFPHFQWVFKYGVTFCTMLLVGLYFSYTQRHIGWILFGYLIGSLIGYFVAEMVLKKSFFVFKNIKGYVIYAAVLTVILLGMQFDLLGYERHLPPAGEIKSISFGRSFYDVNQGQCLYLNQDNIANIYNLHEQLIKDKSQNKYSNKLYDSEMVLVYHLKDGSQLTRSYSIADDRYAQYLKPIYESKEYKKLNYEVFKVDAADIDKLTIHPDLETGKNKEAAILKPEDIREAINILRQDIEAETYEQMTDSKKPWARISLLIADDKVKKYLRPGMDQDRRDIFYGISWEKSYLNFEAWLQQKGYLEKARIFPEEIGYVVIEKVDSPQQWEAKRKSGEWIDKKGSKQMQITDKSQIEACLRNYSDVWGEKNSQYVIGFYTAEHVNIGYGSFNKDHIPAFVKDRL